nr:hypothetical protein [Tanacetum cinerariifolium]
MRVEDIASWFGNMCTWEGRVRVLVLFRWGKNGPWTWILDKFELQCCANSEDSIVTETMTKLNLRQYIEEVQENYGSNTTIKARLMGEALIFNRSLDPLYGDDIELNGLNEPLELKRNQVDDLELTIEEGEVVDEPLMDIVKTRCDNEIIDGLDEYPSYCDFDRKIHISCAYNLQFSCMIGYEYVNANFFPLLSINVMSKFFYNSIMKDKVEYKGKNIVGAFMNVPIFAGNFSVVTNFVVVENIDSTAIKEWVISLLEDHFIKMRV